MYALVIRQKKKTELQISFDRDLAKANKLLSKLRNLKSLSSLKKEAQKVFNEYIRRRDSNREYFTGLNMVVKGI